MIICPECKGEKRATAILCGTRSTIRQVSCSTCSGTGTVTESHAKRVQQGRSLQLWRVDSGLSQREFAKICGLSGADYSKIEHGDETLWSLHESLIYRKVRNN